MSPAVHAIPTTPVAPSPGASSFHNAGAAPEQEQTSPAAPEQVSNADRSSLFAPKSLEQFFSPESTELRRLGMKRDMVISQLADAKHRKQVLLLNPDTATKLDRHRVRKDNALHPDRVADLQTLSDKLERLNPSNDKNSEEFALSFGFPP